MLGLWSKVRHFRWDIQAKPRGQQNRRECVKGTRVSLMAHGCVCRTLQKEKHSQVLMAPQSCQWHPSSFVRGLLSLHKSLFFFMLDCCLNQCGWHFTKIHALVENNLRKKNKKKQQLANVTCSVSFVITSSYMHALNNNTKIQERVHCFECFLHMHSKETTELRL